ncbi:MAG: hypothetical protein WA950_17700 [Shinella sp.]|uniref:hypothetical protein n=1 Tax=Shinella sp. TaxID=1870904 RepID=UPI003C745200
MTALTGKPRLNWRLVSVLLVGAGALVFIVANAHLIHVAFSSQPDCVDHLKTADKNGAYRAARPSC